MDAVTTAVSSGSLPGGNSAEGEADSGSSKLEETASGQPAVVTLSSLSAEALEERAKRKMKDAEDAAALAKKHGLKTVCTTGETLDTRAKRKMQQANEAAAIARKARRKEPPKEAASVAAKPSVSFSLYDDMPEADPEKDAAALKRAEEQRRLKDVPKVHYVEDRTKIIFLDIDGVLRPVYGNQFQIATIQMDGAEIPLVDGSAEFMSVAMANLQYILEQTGAAIVLSSNWRCHASLREGVNSNLKRKGLPEVIDDTPQLCFEPDPTADPHRVFSIKRVREIGSWLKQHPEVKNWVALDDMDLGVADEDRIFGQPWMTPRFVLTEKVQCLTKDDAKCAVRMLNGVLNPPRVIENLEE